MPKTESTIKSANPQRTLGTYVYTWLAGSTYTYAIICIVRMRIMIYTPCESIRKIAKDNLNSKAGEERLVTLHSIMFWAVLARH